MIYGHNVIEAKSASSLKFTRDQRRGGACRGEDQCPMDREQFNAGLAR
jgi:hypothetical protein